MSLAIVRSHALVGLQAPDVLVEVHLANGLPSFTLVGLADTEVKEARERVRCALIDSGLDFPHNKRITVNLAPADLPKESGRYDLPIAIGILAASGQVPMERLDGLAFAGELSLAGELRAVRGALALGVAMRQATSRCDAAPTLVLPHASAREAALVPGVRVHGAGHLLEVVAALRHDPAEPGPAWPSTPPGPDPAPAAPRAEVRDVKGQAAAKRALEVAAAGGHSLLMVGPPGSGKSMLAQRFAGLLPDLDLDEAMASAAVLSLAGRFDPTHWRRRMLRAPHHSASPVALVGGGSPPRPGEISLAHHGVLFLDELPEFPRAALEALREPLENGRVTISRAARQAEFPARFQLVAAMNPCPCGYLGAPPPHQCRCTPDQVARYQARLSGPVLDRIDVQVEVSPVDPVTLSRPDNGPGSAQIAASVAAARQRQHARQGCLNADLAGPALDAHCALPDSLARFVHQAAQRMGWSSRAHHRVLRLARTVADLAGADHIDLPHLAEAIQYRRAVTAP